MLTGKGKKEEQMDKCPKVGDRVRYNGRFLGPLEGKVMKIYVKHTFDEDRSDKWNAIHGKPLPEREWSVSMKPDVLPKDWPYTGNDCFAPSVSDLTAL